MPSIDIGQLLRKGSPIAYYLGISRFYDRLVPINPTNHYKSFDINRFRYSVRSGSHTSDTGPADVQNSRSRYDIHRRYTTIEKETERQLAIGECCIFN